MGARNRWYRKVVDLEFYEPWKFGIRQTSNLRVIRKMLRFRIAPWKKCICKKTIMTESYIKLFHTLHGQSRVYATLEVIPTPRKQSRPSEPRQRQTGSRNIADITAIGESTPSLCLTPIPCTGLSAAISMLEDYFRFPSTWKYYYRTSVELPDGSNSVHKRSLYVLARI